jgi:hypothetical protein
VRGASRLIEHENRVFVIDGRGAERRKNALANQRPRERVSAAAKRKPRPKAGLEPTEFAAITRRRQLLRDARLSSLVKQKPAGRAFEIFSEI